MGNSCCYFMAHRPSLTAPLRRRLFAIIASASALLLITGASPPPAAAASRVEIKVLTPEKIEREARILLQLFKEYIDEDTKPHVSLHFEPLVAPVESLVKSPTWTLAIIPVDAFAPMLFNRPNYFAVFDMPFLFRDTRTVQKFQESELGKALLANASSDQIVPLGWLNNGLLRIVSKDASFDASAKKVAVVSNEDAEAITEMGFQAISLPSNLGSNRSAIESWLLAQQISIAGFLTNRPWSWFWLGRGQAVRGGLESRASVIVANRARWDDLPHWQQVSIVRAIKDASRAVDIGLNAHDGDFQEAYSTDSQREIESASSIAELQSKWIERKPRDVQEFLTRSRTLVKVQLENTRNTELRQESTSIINTSDRRPEQNGGGSQGPSIFFRDK